MPLDRYAPLGRSGLVVSPTCLGTMTFGTNRWGSADDDSRAIFDAYVDAGGNFLDTADVYSKGRSEEMVGQYVVDRNLRDRVVLATKFAWNVGDPPGPLTGGNGRKHVVRALEGSLGRLKTDHVDLYWMHVWDMVTPVEEVLGTLADLVRAGKVRYFGLSNVPSWYAAKMATLASAQGVPGPIALQVEYSLVGRTVEDEFVPCARECGMGITPWSPLGAGFLTGKYRRPESGEKKAEGEGRLSGANPFGDSKFTERNWRTLDALLEVAGQVGRPPAQVALAWVMARPGVSSTIIGARTLDQLKDNLAAADLTLTPDQVKALDAASAPEPAYPYPIFSEPIRRRIFGGAEVRPGP